jgi:WS/DGAT/MGAT family acyltransferase
MTNEQSRREQIFEQRMTDFEALMWNIEKDPWLNPNGCSLTVLDGPVDLENFRSHVTWAVAEVPRLRERVTPPPGPLSPPAWRPDAEFDLSYHIRQLRLPAPGTMSQLLDLVAMLYQDPYDRTRPLWLFYLIDGLEGGRSALLWKFHHAITDGIGAGRLAEYWLQRNPDAAPAEPVDLGDVLRRDVQASRRGDSGPLAWPAALVGTTSHTLSRPLRLGRHLAGEIALWSIDPGRARDQVAGALRTLDEARRQLLGEGRNSEDGAAEAGAPLWRQRSRHRVAEVLAVPLSDAHAAAQKLGGTVNDFFVTGAVAAAVAYHNRRSVPVHSLNLSFVVSTRTDSAIGGNAFTPVRLRVPGGDVELEERFRLVSERLAAKRAEVRGGGLLSSLAGVANLLPTSVVTGLARSQAAKQDFATSNLRGPRTPWYVSGPQILAAYPFGPVAGTAFNLTTQSYLDSLDMGLLADPAALDVGELRELLQDCYHDLLAAGGVDT